MQLVKIKNIVLSFVLLCNIAHIDAMNEKKALVKRNNLELLPTEIIWTIARHCSLNEIGNFIRTCARHYQEIQQFSNNADCPTDLTLYIQKFIKKNQIGQNGIVIRSEFFKNKIDPTVFSVLKSPLYVNKEMIKLLPQGLTDSKIYTQEELAVLNKQINTFLTYKNLKGNCEVETISLLPKAGIIKPLVTISTLQYPNIKNISIINFRDISLEEDLESLKEQALFNNYNTTHPTTLVINNSTKDIFEILKNNKILNTIDTISFEGKSGEISNTLFQEYSLPNITYAYFENIKNIPNLVNLSKLKSLNFKNTPSELILNQSLPENLEFISIEGNIDEPGDLGNSLQEKNPNLEISIVNTKPNIRRKLF